MNLKHDLQPPAMHDSPDDSACLENARVLGENRQSVSSHFDAVTQLIMDEMETPSAAGKNKRMAEHFVLAALLLQGARPVVH